MACFAEINVSQGSVATCARCGGIFNFHFTTNLSRNLPVRFFNRLRFDRIMVTSLWPHFFGPRCRFVGYRCQSRACTALHSRKSDSTAWLGTQGDISISSTCRSTRSNPAPSYRRSRVEKASSPSTDRHMVVQHHRKNVSEMRCDQLMHQPIDETGNSTIFSVSRGQEASSRR